MFRDKTLSTLASRNIRPLLLCTLAFLHDVDPLMLLVWLVQFLNVIVHRFEELLNELFTVSGRTEVAVLGNSLPSVSMMSRFSVCIAVSSSKSVCMMATIMSLLLARNADTAVDREQLACDMTSLMCDGIVSTLGQGRDLCGAHCCC